MINIEDNGLFEVFPSIKTISETFEYQNAMLNKIVLTGKINALDIAENLFNFTEQTAQTFTELQSQIVLNLLKENENELFLKAQAKSQIAIDTLTKNINLRKSDIRVLTKDSVIKDFFENKVLKDAVKVRFQQFVEKYSIYHEILLLDDLGNIRVNINEDNKVRKSRDSVLKTATENDISIHFKKTDMFVQQRTSFFFVTKLEQGYLVAFLRFKDETNKIFEGLATEDETIVFCDRRNNILAANEKGLDKSFLKGVKKTNQFIVVNNMFYVKSKSKLDTDMEWYAVVAYKRRKDINIMAEFSEEKVDTHNLAQIQLNNQELQKLASDGYAILEDLSDVIINGELIAAKSKQYILIPILDNLREVSFRIVKLIELSIASLQKVINESITNDVTIMSKFIADSIMRNLYERCNNVKWWSLCLASEMEDKSQLSRDLKYLNDLYPNYSDIFVYDNSSEIVAISNSTHLMSEKIENNYTLSNKDSNKCFITDFTKTKFYDAETFIYYASIIDGANVIGGVGAVFDVKKEFGSIIDSVLSHKNGVGLIVANNKKILYSTSKDYEGEFNLLPLKDGFVDDIKIDSKIYKISITQAKGYREYKNNNLYAVVLVEK